MQLRDYFNTIDLNEIDRFVSEGQEENLTIEFKTVNHPENNSTGKDFDNKNISKALSGFANSNGGIIIWGIKARKNALSQDVAEEKKPIKELTKFLNLLNRVEGQAVIPIITGIIHEKIDLGNDSGFIKTYVPISETAPHMAIFADKHYYKRSGDSFYQCEHYDIIDMFSRKKSPKLNLIVKVLTKETYNQFKHRYAVLISIINEGKNIAKLPYLAINVSSPFYREPFGLDGNHITGLKLVKNNVNYQFNYCGGTEIVIYPDAILDVDKIFAEIPVNEIPPNLTINYMLTAEDAELIKGKIEIVSNKFIS